MAIVAGIGALVTLRIDSAGDMDWLQEIGWFWSGGPDGARAVLSTIAGSVMTVVSIVFSITIAALAQTSSQFGPHVLRNFTSDWGNQFVLGAFIATFIYGLLVLRTVRSVEENQFVPYLSVNIGVALAILTLGVLIYFIHHITQRIQVENVIAEIGHDFANALPRLFPKVIGHPVDYAEVKPPLKEEWAEATRIPAPHNGYVQRVDEAKLMRLADAYDLAHQVGEASRRLCDRGYTIAVGVNADPIGRAVAQTFASVVYHRGQSHPLSGCGLFAATGGGNCGSGALSGRQRTIHGHHVHRLAGDGAAWHSAAQPHLALALQRKRSLTGDRPAGHLWRVDRRDL